jgi:UDP-glucose 4-epimerase
LDNFTNSVHGLKNESIALERVQEITGKAVAFYKCDLLDVGRLSEIFANHKIASVIHFAAMKAVGESMQFPLLYYKNNLIGMINLLEVRICCSCEMYY